MGNAEYKKTPYEQKELLNAYFDADTRMESMMSFDRFRYAFHLGAQLMAELIEGKEELLKWSY